MQELKLIVESLEKGIRNNIYSQTEVYGIQKLIEELQKKLEVKDENQDS